MRGARKKFDGGIINTYTDRLPRNEKLYYRTFMSTEFIHVGGGGYGGVVTEWATFGFLPYGTRDNPPIEFTVLLEDAVRVIRLYNEGASVEVIMGFFAL